MTDPARGARALRGLAQGAPPRWAVVAGSGLSGLAQAFTLHASLDYARVPGLALPSVEGHPGVIHLAAAQRRPVWLCLGRPHFYEHGRMQPIAAFVRTLIDAGVTTLLLTNAAGALDPAYRPGDVMVAADHIFLPGLAGANPLLGPNDPRGPRFPAMAGAYDASLRAALADALASAGLTVRQGVYAMVAGPSYETPAEAAMLRALGADAVGMSTASEAVTARHAGARVAAVSTITNTLVGAGADDTDHAAVVDVSASVAARLGTALAAVIAAGA